MGAGGESPRGAVSAVLADGIGRLEGWGLGERVPGELFLLC